MQPSLVAIAMVLAVVWCVFRTFTPYTTFSRVPTWQKVGDLLAVATALVCFCIVLLAL